MTPTLVQNPKPALAAPALPATANPAATPAALAARAAEPSPAEQAAQLMDEAAHAVLAKASMGLSPITLTLAWADWVMHLAASPGRQQLLAQRALELGQQALRQSAAQPGTPEKDDRFRDPAWQQWPFSLLKAGYQSASTWWEQAAQVPGMARHHAHLMGFYTRQALDALSPSNWPATNPLVLQATAQTMGRNLVQGSQLLAADLAAQQAHPDDEAARELKPLPFAVGRDVAVTPGQVVFRNRLIELIRYEPTTETVHPEPVLIVPSCIMKYYILDLSPRNSMVRYLVGQGFTVYIISWRNPDAADRDLGMRDYLHQGVMEAMAAVKATSGAERIHAAGYCLGGTFLATVAAALGGAPAVATAGSGKKAPQRRRSDATHGGDLPELASITLLATLTDFSEPGELSLFIDDDQLQMLREAMARSGFLSGRQMAGAFQMLGSRDLVWARATKRYLLGEDEQPNDLMSWNADVTRLPQRMHSEYLQSMYLNNALASGRYRIGDAAVGLNDIQAPLFVVGTARDHVAPWRSVYKIHLLTDTHTTFVLASGGHNAGIVSEPGHARRNYQIASVERGHGWVPPEAWAAQAPSHEGSWWEAWSAWLAERSGARVPATPIPQALSLGAAPGQYIQVRYAD